MKFRENFKLVYHNKPSYLIDEEKKTVKCHLTCKIVAPDALFANKIMDNTVITANGYAKCDERDEFDVTVGKKIALARAESLAYHKAVVLIRQCFDDIERFVVAALNFTDKSEFVQEHNEFYVSRNYGPQKPCRKKHQNNNVTVDAPKQECLHDCDKNKECSGKKCECDNKKDGKITLNVKRQYNDAFHS